MRDVFYETLAVLSYRSRSLWCIIAGALCAGAVQIVGRFLIDDFQLSGPYAALTEAIHTGIWDRYNKVSLGILLTAMSTAATVFLKDRTRFLRSAFFR